MHFLSRSRGPGRRLGPAGGAAGAPVDGRRSVNARLARTLGWVGVVLFAAWCLGPVLADWSGSVLGPFGGIDPLLQLGILKWTTLNWHHPGAWCDLPIFFPLPGMLGCMDSLLGQAWMVWPVHLLLQPTAAALYNLAFVGSLLLAAGAMAAVWRASGGRWCDSGFAALALIGAPYTTAQLGHLNQLPPPWVLLTFAGVLAALRNQDAGRKSSRWWSLVGAALVMQAAWGWYGLAYALVGIATLMAVWLVRGIRRGGTAGGLIGTTARSALLPALAAGVLLVILAQPQLNLSERYPGFSRTSVEVRSGSADIQHLLNRGVYRSAPADWIGRGKTGETRYAGKDRQVLNPGWVTLALAGYGWRKRRDLPEARRRDGTALLIVGLVGMVLAFGDSVGLPFTDGRLPLPLEWLRAVAPPFKAFRGAWRFSWLMVIAVAWWAGIGAGALAAARSRMRRAAVPAVLLLALISLPAAIPAQKVPLAGRPLARVSLPAGAVLTLPAPIDEYAEDRTEALWIARAVELGRPVTGGATGWVPPEIIEFRLRLHRCEQGIEDVQGFLLEMRAAGIVGAEIALRSADRPRILFWGDALQEFGAARVDNGGLAGYQMYRFPAALGAGSLPQATGRP